LGQIGPLVGTKLYPDSDRPYYVRGMSVCAGFMALVAVLALALRIYLARENAASSHEVKYGAVGNVSRAIDEDERVELFNHEEGLDKGAPNKDRFVYML
jgi:hypothetical protein